jgi:hypothetical protein
VQAQEYGNLEHVIVSDGPDPGFDGVLVQVAMSHRPDSPDLVWAELPQHDEAARWGHYARLRALELAEGELICYLDDDNAFRPQHVARLVEALEEHPEAGFAYSQIMMTGHATPYPVGVTPPYHGGIDTSSIMHRRELLEVATWRCNGHQQTVDWDLVCRWVDAGVTWAFVAEVTADYYFSSPA